MTLNVLTANTSNGEEGSHQAFNIYNLMGRSRSYDFEEAAQRAIVAFQELGNATGGFFSFLRTKRVDDCRAEARRALAVIDDDLTRLLPIRTTTISGTEADVFYEALKITGMWGAAYPPLAAEQILFAVEKYRAHPELVE